MLILSSAVACLCFACDVSTMLYALCICRYVLVFTFTTLYFHRETRKADTQEKHLELVETLYHLSLIPRLSCVPAFITCSYESKATNAGSVRTWE